MKETIEKKCILKRVKITHQRKIIARVISDAKDHPDANEVFIRANKIDLIDNMMWDETIPWIKTIRQ